MDKLVLRRLFVITLLLLPTAATAQSSSRADRAYCNALSDLYVTYIGHDISSSASLRTRGSLDGQVAVGQCQQGITAPAIPVLERILRASGFSLPRRPG
jgi:hypothetical protein